MRGVSTAFGLVVGETSSAAAGEREMSLCFRQIGLLVAKARFAAENASEACSSFTTGRLDNFLDRVTVNCRQVVRAVT